MTVALWDPRPLRESRAPHRGGREQSPCQKGDASWPVGSWEPLCHLGHPTWLLCHTGVVRRRTRKWLFIVERTANLNAVPRNLGAIWATGPVVVTFLGRHPSVL